MKKRNLIAIAIAVTTIVFGVVGCDKKEEAKATETKTGKNTTSEINKSVVKSSTEVSLSNITTKDEQDKFFEETKKMYDEKSVQNAKNFEPHYVNGIIIVNKRHPVSSSFEPGENKQARTAFNKMEADASKQGIKITAFSTYRSYQYQTQLFNRYVAKNGKEQADTFSARPGFSEHQSGLGFDIGGQDKNLWADQKFQNTKEAKWLDENATKYGFILRYPKDKEWLTGYVYESWHFRYVGTEISKHFEGKDGYTLEEYLNDK